MDLPAATPLTAFTGVVAATGGPLFGAEVILFLRDQFNQQRNITQVQIGAVPFLFAVPAGQQAVAMLILPAAGHWSMVIRNPVNGAVHDCSVFDTVGPLDWWHQQLGDHAVRSVARDGYRGRRHRYRRRAERVPRSCDQRRSVHRRKPRPETRSRRRLARLPRLRHDWRPPASAPKPACRHCTGRDAVLRAGLPAERRSQPGRIPT